MNSNLEDEFIQKIIQSLSTAAFRTSGSAVRGKMHDYQICCEIPEFASILKIFTTEWIKIFFDIKEYQWSFAIEIFNIAHLLFEFKNVFNRI